MAEVDLAKQILSEIIYITIATVSAEGQPWNTPVYSAFDESYNFFWISAQTAQHSQNIYNNNKIFLSVYNSKAGEGTGRGVYVKAKAYELNDPAEIDHAKKYLYGRKNKPERPTTDFMGQSPRRIFKAVPEQFWVNTDEKINGHHVDKRVEIKLI